MTLGLRSTVVLLAALLVACAPAAPSPAPATPKPADTPKPAAPASPAASPAASPVASPVASPAASPAASPSPSPAAAAPTVSGEVASVEGRVVTVSTNVGVRRVQVPESAQVQQEGSGTPADLVPGALVGITGRPDGTAVVVRIFPQGISPKPEQFPMGGPQVGNIMTNARIESFDGRMLTVDLGGQRASITVPPEAEIVKPLPATFADIQPGKRVVAFGTPSGDVLQAQTITILTQPPVIRAQ